MSGPTGFRFTGESLSNVRRLKRATGRSQGALVEQAVGVFYAFMRGDTPNLEYLQRLGQRYGPILKELEAADAQGKFEEVSAEDLHR